jgi:hypothetical protein
MRSDLSQQYTDIKIYPRITVLFSAALPEYCHCQIIVGAKLTERLFVVVMADQI